MFDLLLNMQDVSSEGANFEIEMNCHSSDIHRSKVLFFPFERAEQPLNLHNSKCRLKSIVYR